MVFVDMCSPAVEPIGKDAPRRVWNTKDARRARRSKRVRDPRFDEACGHFRERGFREAYRFLDDVEAGEHAELEKEVRKLAGVKKRKGKLTEAQLERQRAAQRAAGVLRQRRDERLARDDHHAVIVRSFFVITSMLRV